MSANIYTRLALLEEGCQNIIAAHPKLSAELLQELEAQEEALVFPTLSNEICLDIGLKLLDAVKTLDSNNFKPVVIDIEVNSRCIFHYAMPGTSHDNEWWIERKKRTVKHFEKSSYFIGRTLYSLGKTWEEKYEGLPVGEYAAHGGCFPIRTAGGQVVGTITMSGLAQVLDHVTIVRVVKQVLYGPSS